MCVASGTGQVNVFAFQMVIKRKKVLTHVLLPFFLCKLLCRTGTFLAASSSPCIVAISLHCDPHNYLGHSSVWPFSETMCLSLSWFSPSVWWNIHTVVSSERVHE